MVDWLVCNTTLTDEHIVEEPIWHSLTYHHFGLIICAVFALIAVVISNWLIFMHATHYSKPYIQRHIIRILFMIPIYSVVSFLSFLFYRQAIYFEALRDCYDAFAIASFFTLLCHYIESNLHDQKEYFRRITPRDWVWPLSWMKKCCPGIWKTPRSGLTWFNIIWLCIFQYCVIRVSMTIVSVLSQATGRYCESSLSPVFAHIWVLLIEAAGVTIAMYCLIQFYIQLKNDIAQHRPFMKILCIKLVIFFSFWQNLFISFLTSGGRLKPTKRINYPDFKVGIPAMLTCIEMAIFAVLHLFAFSWKPYAVKEHPVVGMEWSNSNEKYFGGKLGVQAYIDAYNPWDLIKAVVRGFKWLFFGVRKRHEDSSYKDGPMPGDGVGLESSNAGTAPDFASVVGSKPTKYSRLNDDDSQGLLGHAQAQPVSQRDPSPMRPEGQRMDSGDLGSLPVRPDNFISSHPTPGSVNYGHQETGVTSIAVEMGSDSDFQAVHRSRPHPSEMSGDTGYHGAQPPPAIIPPPSSGQDQRWDVWAGAAGRGDDIPPQDRR